MEKIRKNFGFGCMRLPMIGEDVDYWLISYNSYNSKRINNI